MVRIKIDGKNSAKIPKGRLFEMNNKFYLIQFTVEGCSGFGQEGDDDGGDGGEDPENEDDTGMEEFQHDSLSDNKKPAEGRGQNTLESRQIQGVHKGMGVCMLTVGKLSHGLACFRMNTLV
jgi:hypothetical protein